LKSTFFHIAGAPCASACWRQVIHFQTTKSENTMNRRNIVSISAFMALGLALQPGSAVSQQKTLKDQLIGSWTLVSNDNVAPDGTKRQIFGPNPKGIMILAADGNYAMVQLNPARPKFKGKTRLDGTAEENKVVVAGTTAVFGTWSADEASKTLILRYVGNLFPNDEGTESRRAITVMTGDELKIANPNPGSGGRSESVFRRAK
jgi:hypothetical protein